jgi:hypothetical protein
MTQIHLGSDRNFLSVDVCRWPMVGSTILAKSLFNQNKSSIVDGQWSRIDNFWRRISCIQWKSLFVDG